MPKIAVYDFLTFFFYTSDWVMGEPPHLHVSNTKGRGGRIRFAKIWIETAEFSETGTLNRKEQNLVKRLVEANKDLFLKAWDDISNKRDFKTIELK